ncbi:MAG: DUF349 domain-containing protein [Brachybacterium sp.]|uniref:DUF349 domain-containing protein n=1 Tax=Brachybacterium sp. TaxID=1891286 RepID=UPI002648F07E|nr:DUF349 domain-containing protein [Brachybacterium sp.]MDN5687331.1 DUF349 domain-containing protein [Brachybacterium sp.]
MSESETPLPAPHPADQPRDPATDQSPEPEPSAPEQAATEQNASAPAAPDTSASEPAAPEQPSAAADPEPVDETPTDAREDRDEEVPAPEDAASTSGQETAPPAAGSAPATHAPDQAAPAEGTDPVPAAAATPSPRPHPAPGHKSAAPGPTPAAPGRKPAVPSPAALAGKKPSAALLPVAAPVTEYAPEDLAAAKAFGSVAEDGTVTVQDGTQVRTIGTTTESDPDQALEPYARGYLDLVAFLDLTQTTLNAPEHTQNELNRLLENLRKNMKEPQVVGDIPALRSRAHELRENAKGKIQTLEAKRAEAREEATRRRTEFVESIEALVATDPEQISWKSAGDTMRQMVPTWKSMQTGDVSLDRPTEEALWKRLSAARSTFDRMRKQFFSQLDERHTEAAELKETLIARAEEMQDSTDWGPTVRAYKDLMGEWRRAPRGSRKKDDAQWKRFKAAQDRFFDARNADLHQLEAEQRENLRAKEALLTEAEAIDPQQDLEAAKASLRSVQDRWEEAGKVPRGDMRRIDDRLRRVERSLKDAEQDEWRRTDPRTRARVEGASSQLHSAIASYEEDLDTARAGGDPAKIAEAEAALEARKEWLAVIERSARNLG